MVGIYMIVNTLTNKSYIGKSINVESRWKSHISNLKNNKHINRDLQLDWNKFGESNFSFKLLEICPENILCNRERHWIDIFNSKLFGYNFNNNIALIDRNNNLPLKTGTLECKILDICNYFIELNEHCVIYYNDLCEYLETDVIKIKNAIKKIRYSDIVKYNIYIDTDYEDYDSEGILFYELNKKYKGNNVLFSIEDILKMPSLTL